MIVDGGNSKWTDDKARAATLKQQGLHYVDVGTSGGVWGLDVGYCMMVGGPDPAVQRLAPILDVLAPETNELSRSDRPPRLGALRPVRRRALREDGPQRHRVRAHAGLRRGLRPLRQVRVRARQREDRAPLEPGLRRPVVALRARRAGVRAGGQRARGPQRLHRRLRRGPLDDRGRDGQGRADAGHHGLAVRALLQPRQRRLHAPHARRAARPVRRPRRRRSRPTGDRRRSAATEPNPLVEALERLPVHPTTLVIFGATGDLARRKLLPALYNLAHEGALPEHFALVGSSRSDLADEDFRELAVERRARVLAPRARREGARQALRARALRRRRVRRRRPSTSASAPVLDEFDEQAGQPLNRASTCRPRRSSSRSSSRRSATHGLDDPATPRSASIIEKPFGTTLAEARELNQPVLSVFDERQVFRIDHYLGKETVQNLLALRFANGIFEPLWNRNYIDHVQITAAEDLGIGTRAGYYDNAGRAARPRPEPHAAAADAAVHGAAGRLRRRRGPRREGQGAARDPAPTAVEVAADGRPRAVRRRATSPASEVPGYLEEAGVPDGLDDRDVRGAAPGGRQLALGRRAVLPAHRQAPRAQGHRDRGDAQARPPPRLPRRRLASACARTCSC